MYSSYNHKNPNARYANFNYSYKGYRYCPWEDFDGDVTKIFHEVHAPDGKTLDMPLSPYDHPTEEYFDLWVDVGCPYPESQRLSFYQLAEIAIEQKLLGVENDG